MHVSFYLCFEQCHAGPVHSISISPELNQFASLGVDPCVRLWKVQVTGDPVFVSLFDISWNHPIRHIALLREVIGLALSHRGSQSHKVVLFNTQETGEKLSRIMSFITTTNGMLIQSYEDCP